MPTMSKFLGSVLAALCLMQALVTATSVTSEAATHDVERRAGTYCSWPGHCEGASCRTYDDCAGSLICISGRCGSSGPGGNNGGSTGGNSGGSTTVVYPTTGTTRRTTITSYNVMSWDNTNPGDLAEHHVTQAFVNNINIAAVHSNDWNTYKYQQVQVTYRGRSAIFQVWDYCSDRDCGGCCTANKNYNGNGFLLDLDSSAVYRNWGIRNAEDSLQDSATFTLLQGGPVNVAATLRAYPGSS